jgi:hypothetical protein
MTTQSTPGTAPVLVGVDGSPDAFAAVRWAAVEAGRRRAGPRLVTAFFQVQSHVDGASLHRELQSAGECRLDDAAAEVARTEPGLPITTDLISGYPMGLLAGAVRRCSEEPQVIEWAMVARQLWLLESRPLSRGGEG